MTVSRTEPTQNVAPLSKCTDDAPHDYGMIFFVPNRCPGVCSASDTLEKGIEHIMAQGPASYGVVLLCTILLPDSVTIGKYCHRQGTPWIASRSGVAANAHNRQTA